MKPVHGRLHGVAFRKWQFVDISEDTFMREFAFGSEGYPDLVLLHDAIDEWAAEHCTARVVREWFDDVGHVDVLRVYFENPTDAFAYRLRWS